MEDKEDEQEEEKEALDDSVESLCFSFTVRFKFIPCNKMILSLELPIKYVCILNLCTH